MPSLLSQRFWPSTGKCCSSDDVAPEFSLRAAIFGENPSSSEIEARVDVHWREHVVMRQRYLSAIQA